MSNYRRALIPGATYFFTVVLEDRTSDLLIRQIDVLRQAYATTAAVHPFETIAICVMPEHLHAIWRLPEGDSEFPLRWPHSSFHKWVERGDLPAVWGLVKHASGNFGE